MPELTTAVLSEQQARRICDKETQAIIAWILEPMERKEHRKQYQNYYDTNVRNRFEVALRGSRDKAKKLGYLPCAASVKEIESSFTGNCHNPMCGYSEHPGRERLSLDHCHRTGKFRGWLCCRCNRAAGLLRDSSAVATGLSKYLSAYDMTREVQE